MAVCTRHVPKRHAVRVADGGGHVEGGGGAVDAAAPLATHLDPQRVRVAAGDVLWEILIVVEDP